ncbi:MAG: hypothetical protein LBU75_07175 [Desulfovibrio sp.]|jgi:hypothetical protein|nr:hypothetical protein [Desulfovibrio sp.]
MENSIAFERALVALVAERVENSDLSHSEFGRRIFGEESGSRLWRSCRDATRPRRILLAEAHRMAELLGMDFPTMIWQFTQEAKARGLI